MQPKKARTVEIDTEKPLTYSEYEELFSHAKKSTIWYMERYPSHSSRLRSRLYEKGYPREPVNYFTEEGELSTVDFVEDTIAVMKDLCYIDDDYFLESKIRSGLSKGKGPALVKRELQSKGIDGEEIERVLFSIEEEIREAEDAAVEKAAEKVLRSSAFRKAKGTWQRAIALTNGIRMKGFDRDTVDRWMEANEDKFRE